MHLILLIISVLILFSCGKKENNGGEVKAFEQTEPTQPSKHTQKAEIGKYSTSFTKINRPWGFDLTIMGPDTQTFAGVQFPQKITPQTPKMRFKVPISCAALLSTTQIPAFFLLNKPEAICGIPSLKWISSPQSEAWFKTHQTLEVGSPENPQNERLLSLKPDVILTYVGPEGRKSPLEKLGVPLIEWNDWRETHPLAVAEWIRVAGWMLGRQKQADSIFDQIEKSYLETKSAAQKFTFKPVVLTGGPESGHWFLPAQKGILASLIRDAGGNPITVLDGVSSGERNVEWVWNHAREADIWLQPSVYNSKKQLLAADSRVQQIKAFRKSQIWINQKILSAQGGNDWYETGMARPDLALRDFVQMIHPDLNHSQYSLIWHFKLD